MTSLVGKSKVDRGYDLNISVLLTVPNYSMLNEMYKKYKIPKSTFFDYKLQVHCQHMWCDEEPQSRNTIFKFIFRNTALVKDVFLFCKIFEFSILMRDEDCFIEIDIEKTFNESYCVMLKLSKKIHNVFKPKPTTTIILNKEVVLNKIKHFAPDNFYTPVFFRRKYFKDNNLNSGSLRKIERHLLYAQKYEDSYNEKLLPLIRIGVDSFGYHLSELRGAYVREHKKELFVLDLMKKNLSNVDFKQDTQVAETLQKIKERIEFNLE